MLAIDQPFFARYYIQGHGKPHPLLPCKPPKKVVFFLLASRHLLSCKLFLLAEVRFETRKFMDTKMPEKFYHQLTMLFKTASSSASKHDNRGWMSAIQIHRGTKDYSEEVTCAVVSPANVAFSLSDLRRLTMAPEDESSPQTAPISTSAHAASAALNLACFLVLPIPK